jgi:transposase-like protein
MTSTKTNPLTDKTPLSKPPRRKRQPSPQYSAQDKAQAILAVWTDRIKPIEVCRQMQINWVTFQQWQSRAMEGMLQALESRVNLAQGQVLSPRLQQLLNRRQTNAPAKLPSRLEQIQNKLALASPESHTS